MIFLQTRLKVADNSGAKVAQCIKILGGSGRKVARIGDIIVISIKSLRSGGTSRSRARVTKGTVHRAIVLRTRKEHRRRDGAFLRFGENSVAILNPKGQSLGTRLFGPLLEDLRKKKDMKVVSLASSLV
jgi:large subunit ribosomal protein L14